MSCISNKAYSAETSDQKTYVNDTDNLHGFHTRSSAADLRSPTPCPGSRNSSGDGSGSYQNLAHIKDEIVTEIKREVYKPIIEMLSTIKNELQTLKGISKNTKSFSNVSCQTEWPVACNANSNDGTGYDIPSTSEDGNYVSMSGSYINLVEASRLNNSKDDRLEPATDTRMTLVDNMENNEQRPILPPRRSPSPHPSPVFQRHAVSKIYRSNSIQSRGNVVQVKPRPKSQVQPTREHQVDNRERLANTLQYHIEDIVQGLAYQIDKLLDDLVNEGCLTRDECLVVKNVGDRKDCTRALLSLLKSKDLNVLEGFVKLVTRYNKEVAHKIIGNVEGSIQGDGKQSMCAVCKIEIQVNIKEIADCFWSVKVIDDNLYSEIIRPGPDSVDQSALWKKVFRSFNSLTSKYFESAKTKLLDYLSKADVSFEKEIKGTLERNQGKLNCTCGQNRVSQNDAVQSSECNVGVSIFSDNSECGPSNTGAIPVIHGGKRNDLLHAHNQPKVSENTHKPTAHLPNGHQRKRNILIKPPLLPKTPSSMRKANQPQSTVPTKCENMGKAQSAPNVSLYDIPSPRSIQSRDETIEHKLNSNDAYQAVLPDNTRNVLLEKDSLTMSEIPPLPTKKNKYPHWKKPDEEGVAYV